MFETALVTFLNNPTPLNEQNMFKEAGKLGLSLAELKGNLNWMINYVVDMQTQEIQNIQTAINRSNIPNKAAILKSLEQTLNQKVKAPRARCKALRSEE